MSENVNIEDTWCHTNNESALTNIKTKQGNRLQQEETLQLLKKIFNPFYRNS